MVKNELSPYRRLFVFCIVASLTYALLVVIIAFALMFPGFGVLILPQPFIAVYVGRWTMIYDPWTPMTIPWLLYILAIHYTIYYLLENIHPVKTRTYPYAGLFILAINLVLVAIGFTDHLLQLLVLRYMKNPLYWASSIPANIGIEYIAHKTGKLVIRNAQTTQNKSPVPTSLPH